MDALLASAHLLQLKCDRQVPCSHVSRIISTSPFASNKHLYVQCIARKVPELCKAYTPGKADQDLNARVSRLEQIVEMALPQFCTPSTSTNSATELNSAQSRHRMTPNFDDDNKSQPEDQETSGETFQSGTWYGTSVSGSIAPGALIQQVIESLLQGLQSGC